jgi:hypothetical protein
MDNNGMNTQNENFDSQTGQPIQPQGQYTGQSNGQYQQPAGQPNYNYSQTINNYNQKLEEPMRLGEWIICLLVMCIPCVGLIMAFVWAFGDGKKSKQNFFRAWLIMLAAGIVIYIILIIIFGASMAGMMYELSNMAY